MVAHRAGDGSGNTGTGHMQRQIAGGCPVAGQHQNAGIVAYRGQGFGEFQRELGRGQGRIGVPEAQPGRPVARVERSDRPQLCAETPLGHANTPVQTGSDSARQGPVHARCVCDPYPGLIARSRAGLLSSVQNIHFRADQR